MTEYTKKKAKEAIKEAYDSTIATPNDKSDIRKIERAVLGAIMIQKTAIVEVLEILPDSCYFISDSHKKIYEVMIEMEKKSEPIDLLTVCDKLRQKGELEISGGMAYLIELTCVVDSASNIQFHSVIIKEMWMLRQTSLACIIANKEAIDQMTDPFELLDNLEKSISDIKSKSFIAKKTNTIVSLQETINELVIQRETKTLSGIPTGIPEIDRQTGGASLGDLILVGARPGVGKSAVNLLFAHNICTMFDIPVLSVEFEQTREQNNHRLMAINTGIDYSDFKQNKQSIDYNNVMAKISKVKYDKMHFEYTNCKLNILLSLIKQYVRKNGVKCVFINQLSFIKTGKSYSREDLEIGEISGDLKRLAKELQIVIYLFVQLNRSIDDRDDVRPRLNDIRLSSKLEEDADTVILLTRPDRYKHFETMERQYSYNGQVFDCNNKILFDYAKTRGCKPFEQWVNIEIGKHWIYGSTNPFTEPSYTFNDNGEVFELSTKTDVFKDINGAEFFGN